MKKFLICAAVALTAGLMSCGNQEGCWEITTDTTIAGKTTRAVSYRYGTRDEVEALVKDAQASVGSLVEIKTTYKKVRKSEADCVGGSLGIN